MEKKKTVKQAKLNLSNPSPAAIQRPTGLALSCELNNGFSLENFKTVQVMTAKLSEFSSNLSENILKSS